ncbi:LLM class F420-dependent oxidoreductase [Actinomadura craniellae]|uniref:LLM class F420-dependent oxidoreductase n=1 Tax=Actinomadura craniellae TaxID=2231787 RepID=A0A365HD85_9ACTN|nr:TIGR03619 family F420-dependent LLM class oxidoreductase [Actinomadura craniellae]RAY17094.1 LLM class F420-dependent oxidoreductase [Actinomadura craniellae]
MQIGFTLPQFGPLAHQAGEVARFAAEAERLGAGSLWVGDRLLAPVDPTVGYGGGDSIPEVFRSRLDPFALLAVAATATERVRLGTNVLNAPWYAPAILARSLTTIDQLSGGRLLPGLGIGWSPEEYQAAGVPMHQRGARLDECLDALEALWTSNPARYEGEHWRVPATYAELAPAQRPRPPLYLAGYAPAALRRVARRADGWLPVCVPGPWEFDPATVNEPMRLIRDLAGKAGRDPGELGMVLRVYPAPGTSLDQVVETLTRAERETGAGHAFVEFMNIARTVDEALEQAEKILRAAGVRSRG